MQPKIALIVITAVVCFLLWTNRRKMGKMSRSLWLPAVWIMYCGSRAVSYWLYPDTFMSGPAADVVSGNAVDRNFLTLLMIAGIAVLWKRKTAWKKIVSDNRWLVALFLYLGLSVLWSDFTSVSFKRYTRAIGDIVMVLIVATEADPLASLRRLLLTCAFVLIPFSVLLVKYYHDLGVSYNDVTGTTMWIGVTTHKNQLGQLACISSIATLWHLMGSFRKKDILFYNTAAVLFMSLWLLKGPGDSTSKTSLLIFLLASVVLLVSPLFKRRPRRFGRFVLSVGVTAYILQLISDFLFDASLVGAVVTSSGRDMTLTGRTFLWDELLRIAALHPVLGVGYGGFWIGDQHALWEKFQWIPESAHNGFLDVYLDVGMVGLVLLGGTIIHTYRNIVKTSEIDFEYGRVRLVFFLVTLFYNLTESSLTKPTNFIWFLFLLTAFWNKEASAGKKMLRTGEVTTEQVQDDAEFRKGAAVLS